MTDELRERKARLEAELLNAVRDVETARQSIRVAKAHHRQCVHEAERIRDALTMVAVEQSAGEYHGAPYFPHGWEKYR